MHLIPLRRILARIEQTLRSILTTLEVIVSNQEHLDADVAALGTATQAIADELAALKAQPGSETLDFSGLDAAVASVQGLAPVSEPAPAEAATEDPAPDTGDAAPA